MLGQANPTDGLVRSAIGAHGPIGEMAKTISTTQSLRIAGALSFAVSLHFHLSRSRRIYLLNIVAGVLSAYVHA